MSSSETPEPRPGLFASVRAVGMTTEPERVGQRWGFGAFLLVEAVFVLSAVFITAIASTNGADLSTSITLVLVGSIVPTVLAAALAVVITKVRGNGPVIDLRLEWSRDDLITGLKLGLVGIVLTTVALSVWSRAVGHENATSAVGELVAGTSFPLAAAIVMFLYVCLLGPVCEELIYRGLLWGAIERQGWSRWAAFGLSTVIFAVSHLEPLRTSLLIVISVPIGIARLITRRLGASIVAHVINNFVPALTLLLMSTGVITV